MNVKRLAQWLAVAVLALYVVTAAVVAWRLALAVVLP
jgi:hypothetical protein